MKPTRLLIPPLTIAASLSLWVAIPGGGRRDFFSFYRSGQAVLDGANPYDPAIDPTLTPPFTLPLLSLLPRLEPWTAYVAWWLVSVALYLVVLYVLLRAYPERRSVLFAVWTLAYMPFTHVLYNGQVYFFLLTLVTVAWMALRRGDGTSASFAIGLLVATKPNFALWPAMLFLAGLRLPALTAFAIAGVLTVAPMLWYGPHILVDWLNMGARIAVDGSGAYGEVSLRGMGARLAIPWLGIPLAAGLALALAWWAWRQRPDALAVSRQALVGSLLAAPLAWPGYAIVLLPVFFHERWTRPTAVAAALFAVPAPLGMALGFGDVRHPLTSLYVAAALAFLFGAPPLLSAVQRLRLIRRPARPRQAGLPAT